jgi:hypothetical protein
VILAPNGTVEASATLTPRELATVEAVNAALKVHPEFQAAYRGARLERVESMRGVDERRQGRTTPATAMYLALRSSGDM